jgi:CheY-like chemotaxis protein
MPECRTILLVDDDGGDVELILAALEDCHVAEEVVIAGDGVVALDYLYRRDAFATRPPGHPCVVLLDLKMPRVDGMEVLRQVKMDPLLAAIPIVVLTSSAQPRDIAEAYRLGANAYVVKPVEFDRFVKAINHIAAFWLQLNQTGEQDCA